MFVNKNIYISNFWQLIQLSREQIHDSVAMKG